MDNRIKFEVRIDFEDGERFEVNARATDKFSALRLALQDARMGSPFGSYASPVKSWEAEMVREVA